MHDTAMLYGALGWDKYAGKCEVVTAFGGIGFKKQIRSLELEGKSDQRLLQSVVKIRCEQIAFAQGGLEAEPRFVPSRDFNGQAVPTDRHLALEQSHPDERRA